jgi:hypothetical protein
MKTWDSSVGIATGHGLDGPGIRPGEGEIFRTCPDQPWGQFSLLYNGYRNFTGGKDRPRRDADPSPPSSSFSHERVELYLYSPLWAVRPIQSLSAYTRVTFTFTWGPAYIYMKGVMGRGRVLCDVQTEAQGHVNGLHTTKTECSLRGKTRCRRKSWISTQQLWQCSLRGKTRCWGKSWIYTHNCNRLCSLRGTTRYRRKSWISTHSNCDRLCSLRGKTRCRRKSWKSTYNNQDRL